MLFICYVAAYLDRVNVGFAELQMKTDLKFSDTVYGLGAGIFFIGYFFFEVPSNILLEKVGARVWIARIMVSWGIVSGLMIFVRSAEIFYLLRFILGMAEAGFFSRYYSLSHLLVSLETPWSNDRAIHVGNRLYRSNRRSDIGFDYGGIS